MALPACGEEEDAGARIEEVRLEAFDFYFQEESLLFGLGSSVQLEFVNAGEVTHSFNVPDLDIEVEAQSGDSVEVTFDLPNEPGLVNFFCQFHPDDMQGTISIGGAEQPVEENVDAPEQEDQDVDVETEDAGGGGPNYNY
jgi:plastocyanin